ncbi:MAG TPA: nucleotide sugar dehydrogenase [Acidimicrobiales bacterium]|nr:nucleotide sugar dehydrogenase [Acidimicrobiales bacterium]
MAKVGVIGAGYVGLTTATCLAHLGHDVVCADVVPERVEMLSNGKLPIVEDSLEDLVAQGLESGRLRFIIGAEEGARDAEFIFLCVPTPQGEDGSADMSYIEAAAASIGPVLESESIVINKSTVPVGSTHVVERALGRSDVFVVSNPEFLREGSAVHDFLHPDRIVIGADDRAAAIRVGELFESIRAPFVVTDPPTAETIKYASNAFLATKVSYINAVANLCEAVGANVHEVVLGMGYDKRIGFEFLRPGPGWGGSCFLPEETVLVEDPGGSVRHLSFDELFRDLEDGGATGWQVLSWGPGDPRPEMRPVAAFTSRPYDGPVTRIRTKMGRRLSVTADHPMIVGDGVQPEPGAVKPAGELTTEDWLPVAIGAALQDHVLPATLSVLDSATAHGIDPERIIVRLSDAQFLDVERKARLLPASRRRDVLRCRAMRLSELRSLNVDEEGGMCGTVTSGTYVPAHLVLDEDFWRVVGLYLAEGSITTEQGRGRSMRRRINWHFNYQDEEDLVSYVADYWRARGVGVSVQSRPTSRVVSVSSRILAALFDGELGLGVNCYDHRVPDLIWTAPEDHKQALLRGIWDGDGSWSLVNQGPSVVFEHGTASPRLAEGMLRLLGELGVVARVKVGRTKKSTVDNYWLTIAGADQIEACLWLFPDDEAELIRASISGQQKRIRPTGYRPLLKNAAWVRVAAVHHQRYSGPVYSLEVPGTHTVVTTGGLVAHNCFPKDTRALVRIAEDAGYDFQLLKGVIAVNEEQHERVVAKVVNAAGGSVEGRRLGAWGLTFKARTDDLRESPALQVIQRLARMGAEVRAYDPTVGGALPGVETVQDPYDACEDAAVLMVLTEWDNFRWLDLGVVRTRMAHPRIVDARNLLDPAAARRAGFRYEGIGLV